MNLRLPKLQDNNEEAKVLKAGGLPEGWEEVKEVLHYQGLPYVSKIIYFEVICRHYNDFLAGHFGIDKTRELVGRKYYWLSLKTDVKNYVRGCNICLTSKAVCYKPYRDL